MAYPASTRTLQMWVADIDQKAAILKAAAQQQHALSLAGTLNMDFVRRFFDLLVQSNNFFIAAGAVSGIAAYLNTEKGGSVPNPVAEFTTMRGQVVATLDWLRANVPSATFNSIVHRLGFHFPTDNITQTTPLVFTAPQTAGYRTILTNLIATVS